jgi:predicted transcriptional regulator
VPSGFVSLRIDEDLLSRYRKVAEDEDRSVSSTIRQALRRDLERPDPDHEEDQA